MKKNMTGEKKKSRSVDEANDWDVSLTFHFIVLAEAPLKFEEKKPVLWTVQCTFQNRQADKFCRMCDTFKGSTATAKELKAQQRWACETCTFSNAPSAKQCEMCSAVRKEHQRWTCAICTFAG